MYKYVNLTYATRPSTRAGFLLAPILYMLALGGIGSAVMFSGYSQILRSNAEIAAINSVRQQLTSAGQTLSASAVLDAATSTIVQPPTAATYASVTDAARLPGGHTTVADTGTPTTYGVIDMSTGVRQLDPWGKYYIYCSWNNPTASPTAPSIMVMTSGPDGSLSTKCGDTAAQGDDRINKITVAEAINRANVWQVNSSSQVKFGIASDAVRVNDDGSMRASSLTLTTPLAITSGGTGAATATLARTNLSVPDYGGIGASGIWGIGITGNAATASTLLVPRNLSVAGATGLTASAIPFDGSADAALSLSGTLALASGGTGATTAAGARTNLGSTTTGDALFTAGSAAAARTTLGSTSLGDELFTAVSAAAARIALALGTMATQNDDAVNITGGTVNAVIIAQPGSSIPASSVSGTVDNATNASSVPASGISGIVGLGQGGTGVNASSTANLRNQLGIDNASNLLSGTLAESLLPIISPSSAGTYNWGTIDAYGRVTAASDVNTSALIQGNSGISVSDTGSNGTVTISTEGLERLTVDPNGNVGIGTTTPGDRLDVNGDIRIRGAAGTTRSLSLSTLGSPRWRLSGNSTAESGSNAGSDLVITRYDDAGTSLGYAFQITRSSGTALFAGNVAAGGTMSAAGGFFGNFTGTFTGTVVGGASVAGSDGQVQFNNAGALGADTAFHWDNTNKRLGIGTATPGSLLDLQSNIPVSATSRTIALNSSDGVQGYIGHYGYYGPALMDGSGNPRLTWNVAGYSSFWLPITAQASTLSLIGRGDASPAISLGYRTDVPGSTWPLARFRGVSTADVLQVFAGSSQLFTVAGGGNVGIGTATPTTTLDVVAATDAIIRTKNTNSNGSQSGLRIANGQTSYFDVGFLGDGTNSFKVRSVRNGTTPTVPFVIEDGAPDNAFTIKYNSGKVGIGTSAPESKLDIAGGAKVGADATCTDAKAGTLAWNAGSLQVCVSTATGFTNLAGAGGGTSQWLNGGSGAIHYSGGNVGIGTTTPSVALHVVAPASTSGLIVKTDNNQNLFQYLKGDGTNLMRGTWDGGNFHHYINGSVYYNLAGNQFTVRGGALSASLLRVDPTAAANWNTEGLRLGELSYATATTTLTQPQMVFNSFAWNGTNGSTLASSGGIRFSQLSAANQDARLDFRMNSSDKMSILTNGNVGIGTSAPAQTLDVVGSAVFGQASAGNNTSVSSGGVLNISTSTGADVLKVMNGANAGMKVSPNLGRLILSGNVGGDYSALTLQPGVADGASAVAYKFNTQVALSNATAKLFALQNNSVDKVTILASGNVGIGTTSPGGTLHVVQPAAAVAGRFDFFSSTNPFSFFRGNGTPSAITKALTGDSLGGVAGFGANDATGFNSGPSARIRFLSTEDQTNSSRGADILFETVATSGQTIAERMRLLNNGNVGVGTTAPDNKFQISDGGSGASASELLSLKTTYTGNSAAKALTWRDAANVTGQIDTRFDGSKTNMVFGHLYNGGYQTSDIMTLLGNGNVGIGTATPVGALTVASSNANALTIGLTNNAANATAQIRGSAMVVASDAASSAVNGAVAWNYYNGGSSPSWSGAYLEHVGTGVAGSSYGLTSANQARLVFQNSAANVIGSNTGSISISPSGVLNTTFTADGRVGIGTTAPSSAFHIYNSTTLQHWRLNTTGSNWANYFNAEANPRVEVGNAVIPGSLPGLAFRSTGSTIAATGAAVGNPAAQTLGLFTSNGTALTERVRIDNAGNVGIGTTAPGFALDVAGTIASSGGSGLIAMFNDSATISAVNANTGARLDLRSGNVPRLTVAAGGNVGIGTTSPAAALDVAGGINMASGSLFNIRDVNHGVIYDAAVDGPQFRGFAGFIWKTGGAGATEVMRLTGGNLGIGVTAPASKLHVSGEVQFGSSGTLCTAATAGAIRYSVGAFQNCNGSLWKSFDAIASGAQGYVQFYSGGGFASDSGLYWDNASKRLGIGTTSPASALDINGSVTIRPSGLLNVGSGDFYSGTRPDYKLALQGDRNMVLYDGGGAIWNSGTSVSDRKLKKDIRPLLDGLDIVKAISPVRFNWKDKEFSNQPQIGFIAQDVEPSIPEVVYKTKDADGSDRRGIHYDKLTAILWSAVKSLHTLMTDDRETVSALKAALADQAGKLRMLRDEFRSYKAAHP